jgi:diguanylate cyclase (GGDEF)-like protein
VARIGGDEFVLLLEQSDPQSTQTVMQRVARTVGQPLLLKGQRVRPALSTGVARYPVDGASLEALLKAADLDLYRSKASSQPQGLTRGRPSNKRGTHDPSRYSRRVRT